MSLDISIEAQRLIDTHHFAITMVGKAYCVRDPSNRRLGRFEGPELLPLLHQAVSKKTNISSANYIAAAMNATDVEPVNSDMLLSALAGGFVRDAPKPKKSFIRETNGPTFRASAAIRKKNKETVEAPRKDNKTATVKKTSLEWTTGKIGILMLKHADKSDTEIYAMCQEAGIKTQLLTIKGLRRYFRLCISCQIAIAEENV
jgi:hypothetical protein